MQSMPAFPARGPLQQLAEQLARGEITPLAAAEEALAEATGMNDPNYKGKPKVLSPQEMARLRRL